MFLSELMTNSKKALNDSKTTFHFKGDDDGRKSTKSSFSNKPSQLKRLQYNCLQCREARTKCDRGVPSCKRCVRLDYECVAVEVKRGRPFQKNEKESTTSNLQKKAKIVSLAQLIHSIVAYSRSLNPGSEQLKRVEKIAKSFLFVQLWKALKTRDFKQLASLTETMKGNKIPFREYLEQSNRIAKFLLIEKASLNKEKQRISELVKYYRKKSDYIKEPALIVASFMGETFHMPNKNFIKHIGNGKNSSYLREGNELPKCIREYERIILMAVENILTHSVLKKVKLHDNYLVTAYTRDNINIKDFRVFDNETQEFQTVTLDCSAILVPDGSLHVFSINYKNFVIHSKNNLNAIENEVDSIYDTEKVNKEGSSPNLQEMDHGYDLFPDFDGTNITSVDGVDLFEDFVDEHLFVNNLLDSNI